MITSVTTTVTTTTTGVIAGLGLVATLILIALLISKELATATSGGAPVRWTWPLNLGIVPLLFAFAVNVAVKLAEVL